MKKFSLFYLTIFLIIGNPVTAQKSGFLNKVSNSVSKEILGKPDKVNNEKVEPEPSCASDQAVKIMDLGGKLQLDYHELSISILSDGRVLAHHNGSDEYYVVKDGVTTGPYNSGDPRIADFIPADENENSKENLVTKYKPYISKAGDKYVITFAGKKYGPYAHIDYFTVTKSKDKFAAMCTETIIVNEDQGKRMEEAMKNAKTDQERMDLAMEFAQQMQQTMTQGGGPQGLTAKLVTNIPNTNYDHLKSGGGILNGNIKYDDILLMSYDKIMDLQMKTVLTLKQEASGAKDLFVNTNNTKYAYYNYGTLTFSDNTTLAELFNPALVKVEGKVYLSYMYYSPKNNAIMQHKIPF